MNHARKVPGQVARARSWNPDIFPSRFGAFSLEHPLYTFWTAVVLTPVLWLRFAQLRWEATQRLYEYYILSRRKRATSGDA